MKTNKNKKGFTLIELLIVISIIAILAGISLVALGPAQKAGRDARRLGDIRQLQSLLQVYYNACGNYPAPGGGVAGGAPACSCATATADGQKYSVVPPGTSPVSGFPSAYIAVQLSRGTGVTSSSISRDPINAGEYMYQYWTNDVCSTYVLMAETETNPSANKSDIDGTVGGGGLTGESFSCDDPAFCSGI